MSGVMTVEQFLAGASRLPAFPPVLATLLRVIGLPHSSAQDVAQVIESDPVLAARLLKLANSSFYGQGGRVASVRHAVVVLGNKTIHSLALTAWTQSLKAPRRPDADVPTLTLLLAHGLLTAVIANALSTRVRLGQEEDAYMGGLLHDLGRVALVAELGLDYRRQILEPAELEGGAIVDRETEVLGFDHTQLGHRLLSSWHLPPFLCDVALNHHRAEVSPDPFLACVAVADVLATRTNHNVAPLAQRPSREELLASYGLAEEEELEAFVDLCLGRFKAFASALG